MSCDASVRVIFLKELQSYRVVIQQKHIAVED